MAVTAIHFMAQDSNAPGGGDVARFGKVVLIPGAATKLLKSPEVLADLERRANAIAAAAGGSPDYEVDSRLGAERARASVVTATAEAMRDEATSRTLTRAIDAGRR